MADLLGLEASEDYLELEGGVVELVDSADDIALEAEEGNITLSAGGTGGLLLSTIPVVIGPPLLPPHAQVVERLFTDAVIVGVASDVDLLEDLRNIVLVKAE